MRNIITIFTIILAFNSCETIDEPYLIDDGIVPVDTTSSYVKKILIEDFTAHKCKYCPDAAREIEGLYEIYKDQIIGMAIHPNNELAYPNSAGTAFTYDFRTEAGSNIFNPLIKLKFAILKLPELNSVNCGYRFWHA